MLLASTTPAPFRPPAPKPREAPIGALAMVYALWRNPLEVWTRAHFELPILIGPTVMGMRAVVNDPEAVRRIFLDNVANYRKDALQLRVLRPGLGTGLLTADGEDWRIQRRALAPLFSPRQVADLERLRNWSCRTCRRSTMRPSLTFRVVIIVAIAVRRNTGATES